MLTCYLYVIFFGEESKSLAHFLMGLFVFLLLDFMSALHILADSLLSNVSFVSIFSQSAARLLILLVLFFTDHKFLVLMKSSLVFFLFYFFMFIYF